MGGQSHCNYPLYSGLSVSCDLFLECYLIQTLFTRLLKGKLGKRSGHVLITYSSYLLLLSVERASKLGKVLCGQEI